MNEKIREQILAVRKTGRSNMFDVPMVQNIANAMRFYELVVFLEEHRCRGRTLNQKNAAIS